MTNKYSTNKSAFIFAAPFMFNNKKYYLWSMYKDGYG